MSYTAGWGARAAFDGPCASRLWVDEDVPYGRVEYFGLADTSRSS